ncbi:hypothetical protein D8867_02085 [Streptococcus salivarius]|jgi:hypothetical protein|uniref:DUF6161 domain-containing protein n=1 Tax=Streptococcus salivarius TaxID=1304 RepID=A0AAX1YD29_STRSL|nr:DUF6161 domain-containing protein [Streptococcus salivarius]RSI59264.1 hypothetical protein D8867_02085 [Streptococcus salivarius]
MVKKTNAQISNFMDEYFSFKINNNVYNLNYDQSKLKFSELESTIQSNYKYWEQKKEENDLATPILENWTNWKTKFEQLKDFLKNKDEFNYQEIVNFIYSYFSSNYSSEGSTEKRTYRIDVNSPINKDKDIVSIRLFIDFYLKSWATNRLLDAIRSYIEIEKNKNNIGYYLSSTESYRNLPALFVLNREMPKLKIPIREIQNNLVQPVSESMDNMAKETEEHFKQTANLVDKNDKKIREIFIEHSREVDEFKHNLEQWQNDKETSIKILEDTYEKKLQLEAPEKLWKERSKNYTIKARCWMVGLAIFIVALIYSAGSLLVSIHDYLRGTEEQDIPFLRQSFIYVALISFLIYLIRIIIKIIISSQHMAMEYEQKEALTRFYQALVYNGKDVDKEERLIIFHALFSKTETGLVKTDNSGESEALIALLSKTIK